MPSDFTWLLSVAPGGAAAMAGLDEDGLCNAIDVLFSREDGPEFEASIRGGAEMAAAARTFLVVLDGIDSGLRRGRPHALPPRVRAPARRDVSRPPVSEVDLPGQIRDCLETRRSWRVAGLVADECLARVLAGEPQRPERPRLRHHPNARLAVGG